MGFFARLRRSASTASTASAPKDKPRHDPTPKLDLQLPSEALSPKLTSLPPHQGIDSWMKIDNVQKSAFPDFEKDEASSIDTSSIHSAVLGVSEALQLVNICSAALRARGYDALGLFRPWRLQESQESTRQLVHSFLVSAHSSDHSAFQRGIDKSDVHSVASCLKWALRHLQYKHPDSKIGENLDWYHQFADKEQQLGHPPEAFTQISIIVGNDIAELFAAIYDLIAAIGAHADQNGMPPARLCRMIGFWLLDKRTSRITSFDALYERWESSGKAFEHLFYAYVRFQPDMPLRIKALVTDYQKWLANQSDTAARNWRTLRVDLVTTFSSTDLLGEHYRPTTDIIKAALAEDTAVTSEDENSDIWQQIKKGVIGDQSNSYLAILAPETARVIAEVDGLSETVVKKQDLLEVPSTGNSSADPKRPSIPRIVTPDWEDFEKAGFGSMETAGDLSLQSVDGQPDTLKSSPNRLRKPKPPNTKASQGTLTINVEYASKIERLLLQPISDIFADVWLEMLGEPELLKQWPAFVLSELGATVLTPGSTDFALLIIEDLHRKPLPEQFNSYVPPALEDFRPDSFTSSSTINRTKTKKSRLSGIFGRAKSPSVSSLESKSRLPSANMNDNTGGSIRASKSSAKLQRTLSNLGTVVEPKDELQLLALPVLHTPSEEPKQQAAELSGREREISDQSQKDAPFANAPQTAMSPIPSTPASEITLDPIQTIQEALDNPPKALVAEEAGRGASETAAIPPPESVTIPDKELEELVPGPSTASMLEEQTSIPPADVYGVDSALQRYQEMPASSEIPEQDQEVFPVEEEANTRLSNAEAVSTPMHKQESSQTTSSTQYSENVSSLQLSPISTKVGDIDSAASSPKSRQTAVSTPPHTPRKNKVSPSLRARLSSVPALNRSPPSPESPGRKGGLLLGVKNAIRRKKSSKEVPSDGDTAISPVTSIETPRSPNSIIEPVTSPVVVDEPSPLTANDEASIQAPKSAVPSHASSIQAHAHVALETEEHLDEASPFNQSEISNTEIEVSPAQVASSISSTGGKSRRPSQESMFREHFDPLPSDANQAPPIQEQDETRLTPSPLAETSTPSPIPRSLELPEGSPNADWRASVVSADSGIIPTCASKISFTSAEPVHVAVSQLSPTSVKATTPVSEDKPVLHPTESELRVPTWQGLTERDDRSVRDMFSAVTPDVAKADEQPDFEVVAVGQEAKGRERSPLAKEVEKMEENDVTSTEALLSPSSVWEQASNVTEEVVSPTATVTRLPSEDEELEGEESALLDANKNRQSTEAAARPSIDDYTTPSMASIRSFATADTS